LKLFADGLRKKEGRKQGKRIKIISFDFSGSTLGDKASNYRVMPGDGVPSRLKDGDCP